MDTPAGTPAASTRIHLHKGNTMAGDRSAQLSATQDALYALGPKAIEILKQALSEGSAPTQGQLDAARDVLDRMVIRRTNG